jgi:hypothetical protein
MAKPKIGETRLVESTKPGYDRVVTIQGRCTKNHREFYRVVEIPGALFLSKSLKRIIARADAAEHKPEGATK